MKYIKNIFAVGVLALGLSSCSDFLDKQPPSSPSQSVFWKSKSDFESAIAGAYSVVYNWPGALSEIVPCFDGLTDNAIGRHNETTYGSVLTLAKGDVTPNSGGYVSQVFDVCYTGITRVHLVMENLANYNGGDISEEDRKHMLGECHALRGYYYSWLYECYREVPLVTSTLTTDNMYQPKASRVDIKNQIVSDYDQAIASLWNTAYNTGEGKGHFTADAVRALKARVLLFDAYNEDGTADKTKMQEVLNTLAEISNYTPENSLMPRTRDNFITANQGSSPEIMFSVRYQQPNITNSFDLYFGAWACLDPTTDLVNAFECTDGKKWGESPLTVRPDESVLYSSSSTEAQKRAERDKMFQNRDERLVDAVVNTRFTSFERDGLAGADNVEVTETGNASFTGFGVKKILQPTKSLPGYNTVSDADVVIMRYAHVLLMIAEAENEVNGPTEKALKAINAVRTRSHQPAIDGTGLTQAELRERIRNEWRVETCFEGLRYFQLKRWKQLQQVVDGAVDPAYPSYIKVVKPAFEFFPLPQGEIDKAHGVLVQDPNYQ